MQKEKKNIERKLRIELRLSVSFIELSSLMFYCADQSPRVRRSTAATNAEPFDDPSSDKTKRC